MSIQSKSRTIAPRESGFTLVELLISMAVLLIISGAAISGLGYCQKQYRSSEITKALEQQVRAAMEQMAEDVGQAGLANSGMILNIGMASGPAGQSNTQYLLGAAYLSGVSTGISIAPKNNYLFANATTGLYKFQRVLVDTGGAVAPGNQEIVTIGAVTATTVDLLAQPGGATPAYMVKGPSFSIGHPLGASVIPFGVFPGGIVIPGVTAGASSATSLRLFGDLIGDGLLKFVIYQCPAANTVGAFSREIYDLASGVLLAHVTLLNNVDNSVDAFGNSGCKFVYNELDTGNSTVPPVVLADGSIAKFVLGVSVTLRARSSALDPQTGAYIWQSRSFFNIQPRNILNAFNRAVAQAAPALVNADDQYQLQVNPTNAGAVTLFNQVEQPN